MTPRRRDQGGARRRGRRHLDQFQRIRADPASLSVVRYTERPAVPGRRQRHGHRPGPARAVRRLLRCREGDARRGRRIGRGPDPALECRHVGHRVRPARPVRRRDRGASRAADLLPPGQRGPARVTSVSLEKQQVSVLADRVNDLLDSYAGGEGAEHAAAEVEDNAPLDTPIEDEFRVDTLSLGWDDGPRGRRHRVPRPRPGRGPRGGRGRPRDAAEEPRPVRVVLTPARARAFARRCPGRGRRRAPSLPVLRRAAGPDGPHLPARQRLQALTSVQRPRDSSRRASLTLVGSARRRLQPRLPGHGRRPRPARSR